MKHTNSGTGIGIGIAAVAAALVVPVTPASATVVERLRAVDEPYDGSYTCTSDFAYEGLFTGRLIIRQGTGPAEQTFPVLDRFDWVETHTNLDTGETFTVRARGIFNEVKARQVDGTVYEFHAVEAGQPFVIEDAVGNVVVRDRGAASITYLFDTLGDSEPGGILFEDSWSEALHGPHPGLGEDFDYCALVESLTA